MKLDLQKLKHAQSLVDKLLASGRMPSEITTIEWDEIVNGQVKPRLFVMMRGLTAETFRAVAKASGKKPIQIFNECIRRALGDLDAGRITWVRDEYGELQLVRHEQDWGF